MPDHITAAVTPITYWQDRRMRWADTLPPPPDCDDEIQIQVEGLGDVAIQFQDIGIRVHAWQDSLVLLALIAPVLAEMHDLAIELSGELTPATICQLLSDHGYIDTSHNP